MKTKKKEPIRMSYSTYAFLRALLEESQTKLEKDFGVALNFIPNQTAKEIQKKYPSGVDRAHEIFSDAYTKLERMKEQLHSVAQSTYRDHPNPEMRKFWGLE